MGVGPRCLSALALIAALLSAVTAWGTAQIARAPDRVTSAAEAPAARLGGAPTVPEQLAPGPGGDLVALDDDGDPDLLDDDPLLAVLPAAGLEPPIRRLQVSRADAPAPAFGRGGRARPRVRGPPAA